MQLPPVERYNPWGAWNPLSTHLDTEARVRVQQEVLAFPSPSARAVYYYSRLTGYKGIEFVIWGAFEDEAHHRQLEAVTLVPWPPRNGSEPGRVLDPDPAWQCYDGWLPLVDLSPESISEGLRLIDQSVTLLGHSFGTGLSWVPKYIDAIATQTGRRKLSDTDFEVFRQQYKELSSLPEALQHAVMRSTGWLQVGIGRVPSDQKLIALYFSLETLGLALWEQADSVGLSIDHESYGLSVEDKNLAIREILKAHESDLGEGVKTAYFQIEVNIRRRLEAVFQAVSGPESDFSTWFFAGSSSPASLRSRLVHGRLSPRDLSAMENLGPILQRLENAAKVFIAMSVRQEWNPAALPIRQLTFAVTMNAGDFVRIESPHADKEHTPITPGLLLNKGVLAGSAAF